MSDDYAERNPTKPTRIEISAHAAPGTVGTLRVECGDLSREDRFGFDGPNIIGEMTDPRVVIRDFVRATRKMSVMYGMCLSIEEIRARAATSRYWAQRLRWLKRRGRA